MAHFYPVTVSDVRRETRDAVVVTLTPRPEDNDKFDFIQGQYLTFRRAFDGEELRRCYSICAGRDDGVLRVGIKRVDGGAFSTWANEQLVSGTVIDVMPPMGTFHSSLVSEASRNYLAFAGGSGITPVLSLIKTTLTREPKSHFTLAYANRSINSIMFREELEDLKNINLGRFNVLHVLESESPESNPMAGRMDQAKCAQLFRSWVQLSTIDMVFLCGPKPMMDVVAASLRDHGLNGDKIKMEMFASQAGRAKQRAISVRDTASEAACQVSITLDGVTRTFAMSVRGQSIVDAALENGVVVPYACKAGVCSTCRAKVLTGKIEMEANHALEDYEVRRGYVLTCQSHPTTSTVSISYDE